MQIQINHHVFGFGENTDHVFDQKTEQFAEGFVCTEARLQAVVWSNNGTVDAVYEMDCKTDYKKTVNRMKRLLKSSGYDTKGVKVLPTLYSGARYR